MNASLIDVAIVLIGIFVALAVAASWVQEQLAAFTHLRGKQLYGGILSLVADSGPLAQAIWSHPLVRASVNKPGAQPSYLDARNFSLALWQSVHKSVGTDPGDAAANAIALPEQLLAALSARVSGLANTDPLKPPLAALINAAGNDYTKLLAATDDWFNSQMDRVSGWYKRTTQWWLLGIGIAIVFGAGIDTISIAKEAYVSPVATGAVAQSIAASVQSNAPGSTAPSPKAALPVAANVSDALASGGAIHILWSPATWPTNAGSWGLKILGLLITVLAVTLGAPFWFDLLESLVNVRLAGPKPDAPKNS